MAVEEIKSNLNESLFEFLVSGNEWSELGWSGIELNEQWSLIPLQFGWLEWLSEDWLNQSWTEMDCRKERLMKKKLINEDRMNSIPVVFNFISVCWSLIAEIKPNWNWNETGMNFIITVISFIRIHLSWFHSVPDWRENWN